MEERQTPVENKLVVLNEVMKLSVLSSLNRVRIECSFRDTSVFQKLGHNPKLYQKY